MSDSEIAIVGLAGRFPGAGDAREYWRKIRDGIECIRRYSDDELLEAGVAPELLANPAYVRAGGAIDGVPDFDADFFGFSPRDAAIMDPQHRHFLEVAWEALEDAAHPPEAFDGPIGVFAGCGMNAYLMFNLLSNPALMETVGLFLVRHTGNDKDFLATRASYCFDLRGPSVSIQTACSTSLVAVHQAVQSLLAGECDMALAGGVTLELPHGRGYLYQDGEILSPDGHCRAFDQSSQGTVFGSGAGVVVLRRLDDAVADRDHIYAVIKGSAINNDGSSKVGYLAPSVDGQAEAVAEAIAISGLDAGAIQYVEAHGTGTPVGDPIEIAALTRAFRATTDAVGSCAIGSVKTNIGHLDTAAGVAGLIKVCHALEHRLLPPSLHFDAPNPSIEFEGSPFVVNAELRDWSASSGEPRRAGVSSLGVGGTNAHVILEQAPASEPGAAGRDWKILPLSARNPAALAAGASRLATHFSDEVCGLEPAPELADVAYTLQVGRHAFSHRRAVVCRTLDDGCEALAGAASELTAQRVAHSRATAVFLFPGGGAQYPGMAAELYETEAVYREQVDRGLALLQEREGLDLRPYLFPEAGGLEEAARALTRPSLQLPALFVVEMALAELWISWGVRPGAVAGHSMGENTAACLAGVLSYGDALGLVALRGRLFERVPAGGMLSVPLPAEELSAILRDELASQGLCLAAVNAPELCVASGPESALAVLERELTQRDVACTRIKIDIAAHSGMLEPILDEFGAYLRGIELAAPEIPLLSNLTGTWIRDEEACDPDYWVRHLRSTVRFAENIETLLEDEGRVLIEVGPGKTLGSLARQSAGAGPRLPIIASLRHEREQIDDQGFALRALADAWCAGLAVDWAAFHEGEGRRRLALPGYAFQRQRYWIEPGALASEATEVVPAIEKIADSAEWYFRPVWRRVPVPVPEEASAGSPTRALTWLVFLDGGGVGSQIAEQLRAVGDRVLSVREADAYYKIDDDSYALAPEEGRIGYDRLLQDLEARDCWPDRVVHLWMLTVDQQTRPGSSFYHHILERGFYSLLFIAQAIGEHAAAKALHMSVVSNGAMQTAAEGLPYPEKATVLGPCRVIPQEYPGITCSNIDVVLPALERRFSRRQALERRAAVASELMEELRARPETSIVAYRAGERWQQALEHFQPAALAQGETLLRDGAVYLITGGLGGVGLVLAEHLARTRHARLVLVGRSPLPPREAWDAWLEANAPSEPVAAKLRALQRLESVASGVLPLSADVANFEQMKEVVRAARDEFGRIDGVFHAAGVLDDDLIQIKGQDEIEAVFAPKIQGTLVLEKLLAETPPDFMVLFSSTSSMLGAAGQVDYVAANCFLDAYAHSRSGGPFPVKAVNWGVWNDVGMAATAAAERDAGDESAISFCASHPWLGGVRRPSTSEADGWDVFGELFTERHWVVEGHRTRTGRALFPGTGILELTVAAAREAGLSGQIELRDLVFVSPLVVEEEVGVSLRIHLSGRGPSQATLESRPAGRAGARGSWQLNAEARLAPIDRSAPDPVSLESIKARCSERCTPYEPAGLRTAQEEHLAFGARWRCLRQVHWGKGEALALLELPEAYAGELGALGLHPALLDVATGYAMELVEGYTAAAGLYVPLSYRRVRVYAPLTARLYSHVRGRSGNRADKETASFDVVLCDEDGRVLVEIEQFTIKKIDAATPFAARMQHEMPESAADVSRLSPAERSFRLSLSAGIRPAEGAAALGRVLASEHLPQVLVSSIELSSLIAQLRATVPEIAGAGARFDRPELANPYVEARDAIERDLVAMFEELLGVDRVGVQDDFFELGGHSLIAVRLFAQIRQRFDVDHPISVLFDAPTVEKCAALIRQEIGGADTVAERVRRSSHRFLVPMHRSEDSHKAPFFLVAGMFGNVLNLRHLAGLIGSERPFYSIQARGLHGDERPHETFEAMAADYLEEVRAVQPHGPYLIGGFSGGGITAYEMAQQLKAAGERVGALVFLDTPTVGEAELTWRDKVRIHWDGLRAQGPGYLTAWLRERIEWEIEQRSQEKEAASQPFEFRSHEIEAGFRAALERYETRPWSGAVRLFRPPLDIAHRLAGGRAINRDRELVLPDNGWSGFVRGGVTVEEVPGDHDSMVLEPNVRVLAEKLRGVLDAAEHEA